MLKLVQFAINIFLLSCIFACNGKPDNTDLNVETTEESNRNCVKNTSVENTKDNNNQCILDNEKDSTDQEVVADIIEEESEDVDENEDTEEYYDDDGNEEAQEEYIDDGGDEDNNDENYDYPDPNYEPNSFIEDPCDDLDDECEVWASEGECDNNSEFMFTECQKSCNICIDIEEHTECEEDDDDCECDDYDYDCSEWAFLGDCLSNLEYMNEECPMSCGICRPYFDVGFPQHFNHTDHSNIEVLQVIRMAHTYLLDEVMATPQYARIRHLCKNNHNLCSSWAAIGECENNKELMYNECALACRVCDQLDIDIRCPLDHEKLNNTNVWKEGDLEKMYKRITEDPYYAQFEPKIISEPNHTSDNCSLWVITLDKFMSEEECDRVIELASKEGYERSETFDVILEAGGGYEASQFEGRTSENAWCSGNCKTDSLMQVIMDRIANLTGIPIQNHEDHQLLKYEVGELYTAHTDYIKFREDGPRIATFFMYLNDVPSGGETAFPELGLSVTPKKGKALLFPSVQNLDPMVEDLCSEHEAKPVLEGVKHAANVWLHMRDCQVLDDDESIDDKGCLAAYAKDT